MTHSSTVGPRHKNLSGSFTRFRAVVKAFLCVVAAYQQNALDSGGTRSEEIPLEDYLRYTVALVYAAHGGLAHPTVIGCQSALFLLLIDMSADHYITLS